jgi:hypothetical protein
MDGLIAAIPPHAHRTRNPFFAPGPLGHVHRGPGRGCGLSLARGFAGLPAPGHGRRARPRSRAVQPDRAQHPHLDARRPRFQHAHRRPSVQQRLDRPAAGPGRAGDSGAQPLLRRTTAGCPHRELLQPRHAQCPCRGGPLRAAAAGRARLAGARGNAGRAMSLRPGLAARAGDRRWRDGPVGGPRGAGGFRAARDRRGEPFPLPGAMDRHGRCCARLLRQPQPRPAGFPAAGCAARTP